MFVSAGRDERALLYISCSPLPDVVLLTSRAGERLRDPPHWKSEKQSRSIFRSARVLGVTVRMSLLTRNRGM
jgi:hypothetical protein